MKGFGAEAPKSFSIKAKKRKDKNPLVIFSVTIYRSMSDWHCGALS